MDATPRAGLLEPLAVIVGRVKSLEALHELLEGRKPAPQLAVDGDLVVAELGEEILAVRTCLHGQLMCEQARPCRVALTENTGRTR